MPVVGSRAAKEAENEGSPGKRGVAGLLFLFSPFSRSHFVALAGVELIV